MTEASAPSFAGHVVDIVLRGCTAVDPKARICSVRKDSDGRTIVRVRSSTNAQEDTPSRLLESMQRLWPLSCTSVVQNAIDGVCEAEIVVPTEKDESNRAFMRAENCRTSKFMTACVVFLLFVGLALHVFDCLNGAYGEQPSATHDDL